MSSCLWVWSYTSFGWRGAFQSLFQCWWVPSNLMILICHFTTMRRHLGLPLFFIFGQLSLTSQLCHTFKVHNSVSLRIFTRLYNYHHNQFYNFPSPQKESLYLLAVIPYSPSNPPSPRLPAYKKRKHPGKQRRSSLVNAVAESARTKRKTWWRRWHVSWAWRCCPPGWVLTQCRNNAKYTKL